MMVQMSLLLPMLLAAAAPQLPELSQDVLVYEGFRVLDAEAGLLREDWIVVVEGERILAAGPRGATKLPAFAAGTKVASFRGDGRILAPGLLDAHVHMTDPDVQGPAMLANGVVFVRDLGSETRAALDLRTELRSGARLGPELIVTGSIVDGDPPYWPFSEACADAASARAAVAKLAEAGVDQIKVYSRLSSEAFHAAVAEAKARGLVVGGHVPDAVSLDEALTAGLRFSEHLMGWERLIGRLAGAAPDEIARGDHREMAFWALRGQAPRAELEAAYRRAAASGCFFTPTLVVLEGIAGYGDPDEVEKEPGMAYVSAHFRAFWRGASYQRMAPHFAQALPHQMSLVKELHDAGVTLVCGTDLANPRVYPGFSLHREMELFQEAGIPAADAIRAATVTPARLCGAESRLGRIAAGGTASFVVLRADPLADVRNYAAIDEVVFRGRRFDAVAIEGLLARARAAASGDAAADAAELEQAVPGAAVHRGRYAFTFAGNPAGTEDFLWTRDGEDWHLQAKLVPQGGFSRPCEITARFGADGRLREAAWRRLDGSQSAAYRVEDGVLTAVGGPEGAKETITIPLDGAHFAPDVFAAEMLNAVALGFAPGDSREDRVYGFGMETWKPTPTERKIRRDPDAEVPWRGGQTVAQVYTAEYKVNGQVMKARSWLAPDGLPIKVAFSFSFGKFEALRIAD